MYVQGSGQTFGSIVSRSYESRKERKASDDAQRSRFDTSDVYEPAPSEDRLALLAEIKRKISNGFYNSDAVADDISYGFATTLNQY